MKFYSVLFLILLAFCSCTRTGTTEKTPSASSARSDKTSPVLKGQWYIENIVFDDSTYVRPSEEVPGSKQYITFGNGIYSINTNCNTISGSYIIEGDIISFGDGAMTEIACDNMQTEDALRKILPKIATVDITNDSIVRLNCTDISSYIILRKSPIQVKSNVE